MIGALLDFLFGKPLLVMENLFNAATLQLLGIKLQPNQAADLLAGFKVAVNKYKINTPLRIKHFFGQCFEETGGLRALSELGGPAYCENKYGYQTAIGKQLGNTMPGDGYKYRGRGFIQITGKGNYTAASRALYGDLRLVQNPDLVSVSMYNALVISAWWWYNCNRNTKYPDGQPNYFADRDDILSVSKTVNGGPGSVNRNYTPYNMDKRISWTKRVGAALNNKPALTGIGTGVIVSLAVLSFLIFKK